MIPDAASRQKALVAGGLDPLVRCRLIHDPYPNPWTSNVPPT